LDNFIKYLQAFKKLKRGVTQYGKAPHKVVMLLSVLQAFQNKLIFCNQIFITPELVLLFKSNWNDLVITNHVCNFALPFWHLKGEKFWHLKANSGFENFIYLKDSVSSINQLNNLTEYAFLDESLFLLMTDEKSNMLLQQLLLDEYFPGFKSTFIPKLDAAQSYINKIETKILFEPAIEYQTEIKFLLEQNNEEEIYLRGAIFKRKIPKIYNNTCCISGMKVEASINVSMIDACHIIPFSESYNDTINNGIALCPNLHRAFDRGLIGINDDYCVIVSDKFLESTDAAYQLKIFNGKQILLPNSERYYPNIEYLKQHKERFEL
jgi:putative restriction endonuclease